MSFASQLSDHVAQNVLIWERTNQVFTEAFRDLIDLGKFKLEHPFVGVLIKRVRGKFCLSRWLEALDAVLSRARTFTCLGFTNVPAAYCAEILGLDRG